VQPQKLHVPALGPAHEPAAHGVQIAEPTPAEVPAAQEMQLVELGAGAKEPGPHGTQKEACGVEKLPGSHGVHEPAPRPAYVPALQAEHEDALPRE
jgi:hypothetical protein